MANEQISNLDFEFTNSQNEQTSIDDNSNKYLTFVSDDLVFGIPIDNVIEIITNHSITKLPRVPRYVQGIINLRGQIIPIIDIRLRMNKPAAEHSESTCIIILEVGDISIGILVDVVLQVFNIENKIAPPPANSHEFVDGITTLPDGSVVFRLDCELLVK